MDRKPRLAKKPRSGSTLRGLDDDGIGPGIDDPRMHAIVCRLKCTGPLGWRKIFDYATTEEHLRNYIPVCVAFGATPAVGARALKGRLRFESELVNADGSITLDRVETASNRFPALQYVSVALKDALRNRKGFTDASRAPILAKLCTFTFVTKLDLSGNDIAVVPGAIGALTNLKELNLGWNKIATLPASIGRLARLETLDLCFNDIAVVPDAANASIGALTNLKHLSLFRNKIATLPASIGRLTALETLNLGDNTLTAVPAWIGSLTALSTLDLEDNRIAMLPDWIGGMTALTELYLDGNQLAGLPDAIGQLTGLETLWLNKNQLTALPESIVALTNLTRLNLYYNPHLIRSAQSAAVQAWLQALQDSPTCRVLL